MDRWIFVVTVGCIRVVRKVRIHGKALHFDQF